MSVASSVGCRFLSAVCICWHHFGLRGSRRNELPSRRAAWISCATAIYCGKFKMFAAFLMCTKNLYRTPTGNICFDSVCMHSSLFVLLTFCMHVEVKTNHTINNTREYITIAWTIKWSTTFVSSFNYPTDSRVLTSHCLLLPLLSNSAQILRLFGCFFICDGSFLGKTRLWFCWVAKSCQSSF